MHYMLVSKKNRGSRIARLYTHIVYFNYFNYLIVFNLLPLSTDFILS